MIDKNEKMLPAIEIEPDNTPRRAVIWLHGLGADGSDFVPIISELHLPSSSDIRFIFPHAPIVPVSINNGYKMRAWFDIYAIALDAKVDKTGINRSVKGLEGLIEKEISRGISSKDILLAGFSQGAAIALATGLDYPEPLAGILSLSGFLPLADEVLAKASEANRQIPIFMAHGTQDLLVPEVLGKTTYDLLNQAGYPVEWHTYPMAHSVCAEEVGDISGFMKRIWK